MKNPAVGTDKKPLIYIALILLILIMLLPATLKKYLATPLAASQISRLLSDYLRQPVHIAAIGISGGALHVKGAALANPPGFPAGNLAHAGSVTVAPAWRDMLLGRRNFRLVKLEQIRIDLCQNSSGVWNFAGLKQRFSGGKPAASEILVEQLIVAKGAISINGRQLDGISLTALNLATKGSDDSQINLAFEDAAHNRYLLAGKARLGNKPEMELSLSAPAVSVKNLAAILKNKNSFFPKDGAAKALITASMRDGIVKAKAGLDFSRIVMGGIKPALAGSLSIALEYDQLKDRASLQNMELTANGLIRVKANGTADDLKRKRKFVLNIAVDEVDLSAFAPLMPDAWRNKITVGGRLSEMQMRVSGSGASGITAASGSMALRGGRIGKGELLLVSGLDATATLLKVEDAFSVQGKFAKEKSRDNAILEAINAPFNISFNNRMKPVKAVLPPFPAQVMGIPLTARFGFKAGIQEPFSASLRIPSTALSTLNPLLKKMDLNLAAGVGSLSLEAAGQGAGGFDGVVTAELAAIRGSKGAVPFALQKGAVVSRITAKSGHTEATGAVLIKGVELDRNSGAAEFDYRIADRAVFLHNARLQMDDASIAIANITAGIPAKAMTLQRAVYPLSARISGCNISKGKASLKGLSGMLKADYVSDGASRWLDGSAKLVTGPVYWQQKPVGSVAAHAAFSRSGVKADFNGAALGGAISGDASLNPFAFKNGAKFKIDATGASLAAASDLTGKKTAISFSNGLLDAGLNGQYSGAKGISCRFEANGRELALTGSGGKTLLAGGGIRVNGGISGKKISIDKAVFTVAKDVALNVRGELENILTPLQNGRFTFAMPRTALTDIVDPLINSLPRFIQEATVDGAVALEGTVDLHGGRKLLEGALLLEKVSLDAPSQKTGVTGIDGNVPFSLDLSGRSAARVQAMPALDRQNYPRIREQLRAAAVGQPSITIAEAVFGPMKLGAVKMQIKAGGGITEITSFNSSFYEGELSGKGAVTVKDGIRYRGDLLAGDLSLNKLCSAFPGIAGYISGRIDGFASIQGNGSDLAKISGFTHLWAKETSKEKMLVSKEFLQRLSGKKLSGFFFSSDRPYDRAEIRALMEKGYLTFENLDILHTNFLGVRDLSVAIVPSQNRISLDHLLNSVKEAAMRGKSAIGSGAGASPDKPLETEFKWEE